MSEFFQVLDATTGNMVTEFASEREAIEALTGVWVEEGDAALLEYVLFRFEDGRPTLVAKERELVNYVASAGVRGSKVASGVGPS